MKIIIAESAWSHNARVNDQVGASGGDNVVTPVVRFAVDHHSRHHIEHRLEQRQFDELGTGGVSPPAIWHLNFWRALTSDPRRTRTAST
jgi:hypothetical protein